MRRDGQRKADGQIEGRRGRLRSYIFQSWKNFFWQFNVADNNKTYVGLHINCPSAKKFGVLSRISTKVHNIKPQGRTNRCYEVTGAFRDFSNFPNQLIFVYLIERTETHLGTGKVLVAVKETTSMKYYGGKRGFWSYEGFGEDLRGANASSFGRGGCQNVRKREVGEKNLYIGNS